MHPRRRYAVYYTPPANSALWQRGSQWLGYDSASGNRLEHPVLVSHSGQSLADLTRRPSRYGFHATLKPPFHLRTGHSEGELLQAINRFAADTEGLALTLDLRMLGDFLALRPVDSEAGIAKLAEQIVRTFDGFRQPLPDAAGATSTGRTLSRREQQLMKEWGYPYVLDRFRFHLTLTGALDPAMRFRAERWVRQVFGPLLPVQLSIDAITVLREDGPDQPFRQIHRQPLARV